MGDVFFFKDFYDKFIVPVAKMDKIRLMSLNQREKSIYETVTHWLIALIWYEDHTVTGWKVAVYPMSNDKPFWHLAPYYETNALPSWSTAVKIAVRLEAYAQQDDLTSRKFGQEMDGLLSEASPLFSAKLQHSKMS
jgi:hypothetical protein